jgi:hypothetical protein
MRMGFILEPEARYGELRKTFRKSSFQRKLESSAVASKDLKSLDPSFRWDDEPEAGLFEFPSTVKLESVICSG